jgi:LmbE family N-acetylglucosaminyl deacetylase
VHHGTTDAPAAADDAGRRPTTRGEGDETMADPLRLMCILAHPDDESLGTGGTLAKYAAEGVETYLVTATRGQRGWKGAEEDDPGPFALGETRTAELAAAARVLGIRRSWLFDHMDGSLEHVDADGITAQIARVVREVRPQVVVSFGPDGIYGHPDHIAISQFATAAVHRAASCDASVGGSPHAVSKLYYMVATRRLLDAYQAAFGVFAKVVDGRAREAVAWPDWLVSARIDAREFGARVWDAISCHRSQLRDYRRLQGLPEEQRLGIFGEQTYYRAFGSVGGGLEVERDLFAGVRQHTA